MSPVAFDQLTERGRVKAFTLILAALFSLCVAPLSAGDTDPAPGVVIRSGCEYDYPPLCVVKEDRSADGFSVELLRATLKAVNRDVNFRVGPWLEVKGLLERGEIDVLPLVGRTEEREEIFDFTFPYVSLHGAIVVRKDNNDIQNLGDLRGRNVAVMEGDNAEEFLRRTDLGVEVYTTPSFEDALRELSKGRHEAVVVQRLLALRLIQQTEISNLRIIGRPLQGLRQDFCFAVKEGDRETLAFLNEGLALVIADGTFADLQAKWFAPLELPSGKRIVVGTELAYPPYSFLDENGRATGYNVDLTQAITKIMGLNAEVRIGPWGEIRQALEDGEIDAIVGMSFSSQRDEVIDFSPPFTIIHDAVFMRRDEPAIETEGDLRGKDIIVMRGDIMHDYVLEKGLSDRPVLVDTQAEALQLLASGEHDCALVAHLPGLFWAKEMALSNIVVVGPLLRPSKYCFAVTESNTALQHVLSEGLAALTESGAHTKIYDTWLGVLLPRGVSPGTVLKYIVLAAAPLALLLIASVIWSATLKRRVAQRTRDLQRSEENWRLLTAYSDDYVMLLDNSGKIMFANHTVPELSVEQVEGTPIFDYIPEAFQQGAADCFRRVVESRQPGTFEMDFQTGKGEIRHSETRVSPVLDEGETVALIANARDITERKRASATIEAWQNRYQAAVNVSGQILYDWDSTTDKVVFGGCLEEVLGYTDEDMTGGLKCWIDKIHPDDVPGFNGMIERVLESGKAEFWTYRVQKKDGTFAILEDVGECFQSADGELVRMVGFLKDITEQKQNQEELQVQHQNLETLVQERTAQLRERVAEGDELNSAMVNVMADLQRSNQKLEKTGRQLTATNKELNAFSYTVSHDLRAPLRHIAGFVSLLENREKERLDSTSKRYLETIATSSNRMARLIDDLLAFFRIGRGETHLQNVDSNEVVNQVLAELSPVTNERNITWIISDLPVVEADRGLLLQVWQNLIGNAIKYTGRLDEPKIEIGVLAEGTENSEFVFFVRDNGIGFDPQYSDKLFGVFQRLHDHDQFEGTGIGLATVHRIVERHGGRIWAEGEVDRGATFFFSLKGEQENPLISERNIGSTIT